MTSYTNAIDAINKIFKDSWDLNSLSIVGYIPEIRWQGKEEAAIPDNDKYWVRVSIQSVFQEQKTLNANVGKAGAKRYTSDGLVFIQLFIPKNQTNAWRKGQLLAELAQNAYRGKNNPACIIFRNVRINELPKENEWYRLNVVAEYQYDEIY